MLSAKQLAINGHVIAGGTDMLFAQELEDETFIKLLPTFQLVNFLIISYACHNMIMLQSIALQISSKNALPKIR